MIVVKKVPGTDSYYMDLYGYLYSTSNMRGDKICDLNCNGELFQASKREVRHVKSSKSNRTDLSYILTIDGKQQAIYANQLMWMTWVGMLRAEHQIHHKDENPLNNALTNLECLSVEDHWKEHALEKKHIGSISQTFKVKKGNQTLTLSLPRRQDNSSLYVQAKKLLKEAAAVAPELDYASWIDYREVVRADVRCQLGI